jgi:hypothetical protein
MELTTMFLRTDSGRTSGFVSSFSSALSATRASNGAAFVQGERVIGGGARALGNGGENSCFLSLFS